MPGVYLSYPFCGQKCTYCNFASAVLPRDLEMPYAEALLQEIRSHAWAWRPETVYWGGGTPSGIDLDVFERLMAAIPGRPWAEATLEAAPGTITAERARRWSAAGITRVSLGVQSFVKQELARTGRRHDAETVAADLETLRTAGIGELNIDLIAGLPGQTAASWRESLDWIRRLEPSHVSVYMLEVDEDSRLGKEMLLGGVRYGAMDVPGENAIVAFYETAVAELAGMGIERYEISNFARPGHESLHNLKYWRREAYVGFGSDAHSFDGTMRKQNAESAADYIAKMAEGSAMIDATPAVESEERFFVGLRLAEGIRPTAAEWKEYAAPIERFVAQGLMERNGARLRLTDQGILFSNEVFEEFVH